ncbi:type IX secretion system membrane protein PorP/SprF [uncultured Draconibacterium sp.]|uniref:PorP/SprF family type IX secretion system membrane protein n=1 Tax=uncultured Draconibacterium sp. TaxID=1573823 RepID=UPI0029C6DF82|nr:type IX secretion system membrane protein PorP/SprF [uncultured Draconibacterium sp.]
MITNIKNNTSKGLGILLMVLTSLFSTAQQDPAYTQYMFNTQTINPAYAGTWNTVGFMALTRHQWTGIDGAPKTYTFSVQAPLKNEKVALGLNVINDEIGLEKRFSLHADYSYRIKVSDKSHLRMGLKGGFTNYSHNLQAHQLSSSGGIDDPTFQGEINSDFMPNFGVGAFLYSTKYYVGLSVPQVLVNEFENNYNNYKSEAQLRHYFLIAGAVFDLGENVKFKPTFLTKATNGAPVQFDFTGNFLIKERFWLGAMYRTGDSYGFIAQWIFAQKLRLGYAIDFSINDLRHYSGGTHEIMVSYELKFRKERVVSPRYF